MRQKLTHKHFIQRLAEKNNTILVLGEYQSMTDKILCQCKMCQHKWMARPTNLLMGKGCPPCGNQKNTKSKTKTHEQFISDLYQINPYVQIDGTYINNHTKLHCKCLKCQHEWDSTPANLLKPRGCPQCSLKEKGLKRRLSHEEFVNRVSISNPNIEIIEQYTRTKDNVRCKCKTCAHIWESRASLLLKGIHCPKCFPHHTSLLEQVILLSLRKTLGEQEVLSRDVKAIGKELDIYLPSFKVGIEPGSWYWHANKTFNDSQKYQLAKENGIRLIVIFDDFDADDSDLIYDANDLITYKEYLGAHSKRTQLWHCVETIYQRLNLQYTLSQNDKDDIEQSAFQNSIAQERDYITEIIQQHPTIEILDTYQGYNTKMRCLCKKCQHKWSTTPATLLRGSSCPACNKQKIVKNTTTGEIFPSIALAANATGLNRAAIAHVCHGRHKTCGGYTWEFV